MSTEHLHGKNILVTGGTGTFGRAIVRRLLAIPEVKRVIILSRDEYKQSQMQGEPVYQDPRLSFFLGDIRDKARLLRAFNHVDIVVHAAALKQVPALEYNPSEAIETNVIGTRNVIDAALDRNVEQVLFISSDKAVQPVNLYGATKMCAERLAIAANSYRGAHGRTRISVIRYGNVLGSRGSIVEVVGTQRPSGRLTLTDARMTRFWIHIDKVIDSVFEALRIMDSGEIFIPKMTSTYVKDLLQSLAPECELIEVGMRPGEKLHETLITEHESARTRDAGILCVIEPEFATWGRGEPLARYPRLAESVAYTSDSELCLLPPERVGEVLAV
ncbi:MAG: SDR family NAD(P)-dependent oxidoreductase [bacterium]|nr:SDR family NAD(P)-dependent oxidoreductase [bacterium]